MLGDLDAEIGATDMDAIRELDWDWPLRTKATVEESCTSSDGVCTHLSFMLIIIVDLHDSVELR